MAIISRGFASPNMLKLQLVFSISDLLTVVHGSTLTPDGLNNAILRKDEHFGVAMTKTSF
jgi:hypothetical protein